MAHVKQQKAHTRQSGKNSVSPPGPIINHEGKNFLHLTFQVGRQLTNFQTNKQVLPFFLMDGKFPGAGALKL